MSIFKVEKVLGEPTDWQSANGTMQKYQLWGSLDGQPAEMAQINTVKAKPKVPVEGEEINCEAEKTQYGLKLKRTMPNPVVSGQQNTGYQRNPADQEMIMRQHAVTDSLSYFALQTKKGVDDHTVLLQAERFLDYYKNGLKAAQNDLQDTPPGVERIDDLTGYEPVDEEDQPPF